MNRHRYSFFGQKTGILLDSGDMSQLGVYFTFVKKLGDSIWEKPSQRQGKSIKFNLGEILHIIKVLTHPKTEWTTVHKFKQETTPITWKNTGDMIAISIPGYGKYLKFPDSVILRDLLTHIYHEKLEQGTGIGQKESVKENPEKPREFQKHPINSNISPSLPESDPSDPSDPPAKMKLVAKPEQNIPPTTAIPPSMSINPEAWLENLQSQEEYCLVPGELIAEREKAIAFKVSTFNEIWVPRSVINENGGVTDNDSGLWIKQWFLAKKLEDIFRIQT